MILTNGFSVLFRFPIMSLSETELINYFVTGIVFYNHVIETNYLQSIAIY